MANFDTLKTAIDANIKANGSQDITGDIMNYILKQMVDATDEQLTELSRQVIYDITANNESAKFASLSALLSSENLSTLIPIAVRCGGMSIRFVQTSDNKYVQYRLMADSFTTDVTQWQGVDDEPTAGSDNLVKSGGVKNYLLEIKTSNNLYDYQKRINGYYINYTNGNVEYNPSWCYVFVDIEGGKTYITNIGGCHLAFFDANDDYISGFLSPTSVFGTPANAVKMAISCAIGTSVLFSVVRGNVSGNFKNHRVIDNSSIQINSILPDSINIAEVSKVFAGIVTGKNIFNKDSENLVRGYYKNYSSGAVEPNQYFCYLDIECKPNTAYVLSGCYNSQLAFFNSYGEYISGMLPTPGVYFTTPNDCYLMTVSTQIANIPTAQLEAGTEVTEYNPYHKEIDKDLVPLYSVGYDNLKEEIKISKIINVGVNRDYTSILEALNNAQNNTTIFIDAGYYNIEDEYKDKYGSTYFEDYSTNYNQDFPSAGSFNYGLFLGKGVSIIGIGNVIIDFPYSGNNENVKQHFSIINTTTENTIKNITIKAGSNNCRYHIHDDFAQDSANLKGTNIIENVICDGTSYYTTCIGGGMGLGNTYIIKDCIFLSKNVTSISYHNSVNSNAENLLYISDCYCNGSIRVLSYGTSTKITYCSIKGNRCTEIYHGKVSPDSEDNTTIFDWGNIIPNQS